MRVSGSSPVKGSTGGAFPRRVLDPTACEDDPSLVWVSPPTLVSGEEAACTVTECGSDATE